MAIEHPDITRAMDQGHPFPYSTRQQVRMDSLGNEVISGDEIMVLHDEFWLRRELFQESIEILESLGATTEIAQ